ncbi:MAG: acylneuraminate cytidylyltransferase family protein [Desulfovibrionaceae bacterium]
MSAKPLALGFIPARGGSKGVPGKNLKPLAEKPLIHWTIEAALASRLDRVLLSTDAADIAEAARQAGAEAPFLRPAEFSGDASVMDDAILHALKWLRDTDGWIPDVIVVLQPTSPLRRSEHIDGCLDLLIRERACSVVSVSDPMEHPSEMVYWTPQDGMRSFLESCPNMGSVQRQAYPKCYFVNGAVYAFTREALENGQRMGAQTLPFFMEQKDSIDIDTPDDFEIAEALMLARLSR